MLVVYTDKECVFGVSSSVARCVVCGQWQCCYDSAENENVANILWLSQTSWFNETGNGQTVVQSDTYLSEGGREGERGGERGREGGGEGD